MNSKTAVIGLGIFGREVALSLAARGHAVMAIDISAPLVEDVKEHVAQALIMDTTDEQALHDAKIEQMDTVVNAIGTQHLQNSILTTALLAQFGVRRIIGRATNALHERILRQVGATEVINPEREIGRKIARHITRPGLRDVLELCDGVCVAEVPAPASFVGHTVLDIDCKKRYGVGIIGIQRVRLADVVTVVDDSGPRIRDAHFDQNRRMILDLSPDQDILLENDVLVVIGPEENIDRLAVLG